MDVSSVQSDSFIQYLQHLQSLPRNGSANSGIVTHLYRPIDPGAVWKYTGELSPPPHTHG